MRFALTSILCQGERKWPPSATHTPPLDSRPVSGYGACFRSNCSCRQLPAHQGMKIGVLTGGGVWVWLVPRAPIPALTLTPALSQREREIAELWGWELRVPSERPGLISLTGATYFRANRSCRLVPAHRGLKSRSCGLVQRIGTADSATPHPDPSGGQAPRLAKSSTALHLL